MPFLTACAHMSFCIEYVQSKSKHDVGRSLLVDCVNDKCAIYRRKSKAVKVNDT